MYNGQHSKCSHFLLGLPLDRKNIVPHHVILKFDTKIKRLKLISGRPRTHTFRLAKLFFIVVQLGSWQHNKSEKKKKNTKWGERAFALYTPNQTKTLFSIWLTLNHMRLTSVRLGKLKIARQFVAKCTLYIWLMCLFIIYVHSGFIIILYVLSTFLCKSWCWNINAAVNLLFNF